MTKLWVKRWRMTLGALGTLGLAAASPALAWKLESRTALLGDPPSCLIRADRHGAAVTHYRWPAGEPTTLLTIGVAKPDGPLEVMVDDFGPVSGRAADRRVWSRPDLIAAMKAGRTLSAEWTNREGEPTSAKIDLAGLAEALAACEHGLEAASAK